MKSISIIGAGPAGIEAASILAKQGVDVTIFEKSSSPMKNVADKAYLFPNFAAANDIVEAMNKKLMLPGITQQNDTDIVGLTREGQRGWKLTDSQGNSYYTDMVLLATGYTPFDAHRKEELGYSIYGGVVTSIEMERMIRYNQVANTMMEKPRRVVFLQCVGSRDEKSGNHYCSKVCCVTAVKQAIEIKKQLPDTETFIFYMDLRMWGQHFEEMYRMSQQEYGVRYVRGRISEASGTFDGRVQIKAEDTLMGMPLKMTTDLLVLMVGMEASAGTRCLAQAAGICGEYGFAQSIDPHLKDCQTTQEGLFVCGTCKRPMSINDAVNDARAAALAIIDEIK
ncbi:MAG: CoB--CoM heterodisulfide reductase iron-sulfur subunit A family protein [Bacteroidales bacterium]|nr:CoB--CoM heterodisulfide reductase iron-sulfur subunit A family protein [Bacteroidales bacterium]